MVFKSSVGVFGGGGGGPPGGIDGQYQFNDNGVFGGTNIWYDIANDRTSIKGSDAKLFLESTDLSPPLIGGIATENSGQIIDCGSNYNQLLAGDVNPGYAGGFFRIDLRDLYQSEFWNLKHIPIGDSEQTILNCSSGGVFANASRMLVNRGTNESPNFIDDGSSSLQVYTMSGLVQYAWSGAKGIMDFPYESAVFERNGDQKFGIYSSSNSFTDGASFILGYTNNTDTDGFYPGVEMQNVANLDPRENNLYFTFLQRDIDGNINTATRPMTLTSLPGVGINQDNPQYGLDIFGTNTSEAGIVRIQANPIFTTDSILLGNSGGNGQAMSIWTSSGDLCLGDGASGGQKLRMIDGAGSTLHEINAIDGNAYFCKNGTGYLNINTSGAQALLYINDRGTGDINPSFAIYDNDALQFAIQVFSSGQRQISIGGDNSSGTGGHIILNYDDPSINLVDVGTGITNTRLSGDGTSPQNSYINSEGGFLGIGINPPETILHVVESATSVGNLPRGILIEQNDNSANAPLYLARKSRGTFASPASVQNGDGIWNLIAQGYDGSGWQHTCQIIAAVDNAVSGGSIPTALDFYTGSNSGGAKRLRLTSSGLFQFSGSIFYRTGTATASTAPAYFASGSLLTSPVIGADEFLTDKRYITISTGTARKEYTINDAALTSGRVPFVTTNGRLTDASTFQFSSGQLTVSGISVSSGANLITSTAAFTNGAGLSAATLTNAPAIGNPTKWIPINDNGTTRYIPAW